jgi:hypothetical protein
LFGKVDRFSDNVVLTRFDFGDDSRFFYSIRFPIKQDPVPYSYGIGTFNAFDSEFSFDSTIVKYSIGFHAVMASC